MVRFIDVWNRSKNYYFIARSAFLGHTMIWKGRCRISLRMDRRPEHAPEIFQTSCSWHSILVLHYTSQTHVFRNPRQYLVEQNQCNAKQVLARPVFPLWRQHNFHVMEQWSTRRCPTTRHLSLPKSIYTDYVISVFSYIIRFSWMILLIARLCHYPRQEWNGVKRCALQQYNLGHNETPLPENICHWQNWKETGFVRDIWEECFPMTTLTTSQPLDHDYHN